MNEEEAQTVMWQTLKLWSVVDSGTNLHDPVHFTCCLQHLILG